jgi:hypothetical protein
MEALTVTAWKRGAASTLTSLMRGGVLFDRTVLAEYPDLLTKILEDRTECHMTQFLLLFKPDLSGRLDLVDNWRSGLANHQFGRSDDAIGMTRKPIECCVAVADRSRPPTEEEQALQEAMLKEARQVQDTPEIQETVALNIASFTFMVVIRKRRGSFAIESPCWSHRSIQEPQVDSDRRRALPNRFDIRELKRQHRWRWTR